MWALRGMQKRGNWKSNKYGEQNLNKRNSMWKEKLSPPPPSHTHTHTHNHTNDTTQSIIHSTAPVRGDKHTTITFMAEISSN